MYIKIINSDFYNEKLFIRRLEDGHLLCVVQPRGHAGAGDGWTLEVEEVRDLRLAATWEELLQEPTIMKERYVVAEWAAFNNYDEVLQLLVDSFDVDVDRVLRTAVVSNRLVGVQNLLASPYSDRLDLSAAVEAAAMMGYVEIIKCIGLGENKGDWALVRAAKNGHLPAVEYLVEQGADVRAFGDMAIQSAQAYRHHDVVTYLASKGAHPR